MSVLSLDSDADRRALDSRKESLASVYSGGSAAAAAARRRRAARDGMAAPRDRALAQRVLSAKTHRVKQLQNQLADAQFHLQELSNENKMLRALQKKQETALQRYESSDAALPQMLSSHSEELRAVTAQLAKLKSQHKETSQQLKERELQLRQLRDEHQQLLALSRDKSLPERARLAAALAALEARAEEQRDTIASLTRRLALQDKNHRHQLQAEISKHRDTRLDLDRAINNADKLSTIIEMKEKLMCSVPRSNLTKLPKKFEQAEPTRPARGGGGAKGDSPHRFHDEKASGDMLSRLSASVPAPQPRARSRSGPAPRAAPAAPPAPPAPPRARGDAAALARTVQNGMADLALYDDPRPDPSVQDKLDSMKADLMKKINNNEDLAPIKMSMLRKRSEDEERPASRARLACREEEEAQDGSGRAGGAGGAGGEPRPLERYCQDIMHDIARSNKAVDQHVRDFSASQAGGARLLQQLQALDRAGRLLQEPGDGAALEPNNNLKALPAPPPPPSPPRRRSAGPQRALLGDTALSNQDLLDDLLGKK